MILLFVMDSLSSAIKANSVKIWNPRNIKWRDQESQSWYDVKTYCTNKSNKTKYLSSKILDEKSYMSSKKVILRLNSCQKQVIKRWCKTCTCAYNAAIDYFNASNKKGGKISFSKISVRNAIKETKLKLVNESFPDRIKIPTHIVDEAIGMACSMAKSAISNLKAGHIKHFKLRRLKHDRKNQVLRIEPQLFTGGSLYPRQLGQIKGIWKNGKKWEKFEFNRETIKHAVLLRFDSKLDEFVMFVPETHEIMTLEDRSHAIALDPGLRTILTGYGTGGVLEMGTNVMSLIKRYQKKKDKLEKMEDSRKKRKILAQQKKKLDNKISDFHWKAANYLACRYDNVMLGNMSTKGIVKKRKGQFGGAYKNAIMLLKHFQFKQRLEHVCHKYNSRYHLVDEAYTTQLCSQCGNGYKIGDSKTYNCENCGLIMDRDINSARNIYMKCL